MIPIWGDLGPIKYFFSVHTDWLFVFEMFKIRGSWYKNRHCHRSYCFVFWRVWKRKDFFRTVGTVFLQLGLDGATKNCVIFCKAPELVLLLRCMCRGCSLVLGALLFWQDCVWPFYMAFYLQTKQNNDQRWRKVKKIKPNYMKNKSERNIEE